MRIKGIISILIIGLIISCQTKNENSETVEVIETVEIKTFKTPEIINSQFRDTIKPIPFKAEFITGAFPVFKGKYKFQNKIDINPQIRDTTKYKEYIYDRTSLTKLKDSLDISGFELIVDYEASVKYNSRSIRDSTLYEFYPVYFVNSTNSDKLFLAKDSYVLGLQEARDNDNNKQWHPIESRGFDWCGNGHWGLIVHPREFVLVLMRKYEGEYETEMRTRFKLGKEIFISKPFVGQINPKQFFIKDGSFLEDRLEEKNEKTRSRLFYGAVPKEEK